MSSVTIPIPPGKVIYWQQTEHGLEIEFMRFLTLEQAKLRRDRLYQRKDAA